MTELTKAEQLAQDPDGWEGWCEEAAAELRRLSPMEAERDKLLAALNIAEARLEEHGDAYGVGVCAEAIKLTGEIK
jgi:hypothetical protein